MSAGYEASASEHDATPPRERGILNAMRADEIDELVRQGVESYNARDAEASLSSWDPECEWHPFLSAEVEGATAYRGHEGLRQWYRDTDEMFSEVAWRVEAVRDLGEDRVLVLGHLHARGRISGAEVSSEIGHLFELREGRVLRGWAYPSHQQALGAAGAAR
jgi:ketosteroid isomerase-like protein